MMDDGRAPFDLASEAAERIRRELPLEPRLALILGSGLGAALGVEPEVSIPYGGIPHFPVSTVPGHAGALLGARVSGLPVVLLSGRAHLYEGYTPDQVVFGVRVAAALGVSALIVTNAAGAVNPSFRPGDLMVIADHLNLTGQNPLAGPGDERLGARFPDMSAAYTPRLRRLALDAARSVGQEPIEGIYCGLLGPSFETPAEIRMLRTLGADAVGMSTVLEVIAANQLGLEVLGISCITNMAAGILAQPLSHQEVVETTERVRETVAAMLQATIAAYAREV